MSIIKDIEGRGDISSELTLLEFVFGSADFAQLSIRVGVGGPDSYITAAGTYTVNVYINSHLIVPVSSFTIASGITRIVANGRPFIARRGDTIRVSVVGRDDDTNVRYSVLVLMISNTDDVIETINEHVTDAINAAVTTILERIGASRVIEVIERDPESNLLSEIDREPVSDYLRDLHD